MRTQAIIIKKIAIRDYDESVVCYTQDSGKQAYQAKGVLKSTSKQAGHLDIMNLIDFSLVHKNSYPIITSAHCLNGFPRLKSSLPAMSVAYFILECFNKIVFENQHDDRLWNFLINQLRACDQQSHDQAGWSKFIISTRQELLQILGYDSNTPIEQLANSQFSSLQFAREVLK